MKYRTRKAIESVVNLIFLALVILLVFRLKREVRRVNNINYKKLVRKITQEPKEDPVYFEGEPQLKKTKLTKDHVIHLGDLSFAGVDPLSEDEFENGIWDLARVKGYKNYYKEGNVLSSSKPVPVVDYSDDNYDYVAQDKKYRDLIADVSRELEYKDDKKKGEKKKSRWGKKSPKGKDKTEEKKPDTPEDTTTKVVTPPPMVVPLASEIHSQALKERDSLTILNLGSSRILSPLAPPTSFLGQAPQTPSGSWSDSSQIKLYVIPIGGQVRTYEEASAQLDLIVENLEKNPTQVATWTELQFFERWFRNQNDASRDTVRTLVTKGQLEFSLAGWSGPCHEGVSYEDLIADYADAQQWLQNVFSYRCQTAYVSPQHAISSQVLKLLKAGGVEMVVVDGADSAYLEAVRNANSEEFLWETDRYLGGESRILVHICGNAEAMTPLWTSLRGVREDDVSSLNQVKTLLQAELSHLQTDGRVLLLWSLSSDPSSDFSFSSLQTTLEKLTDGIIAAPTSLYRYLLDVYGSNVTPPVRQYELLPLQSPSYYTGFFAAAPLRSYRMHLASRFRDVFERYYAYCSIHRTCATVPQVTPDMDSYVGDAYLPREKPDDQVYYWLVRTRQETSLVLTPQQILSDADANGSQSSHNYLGFHHNVLTAERVAGKMIASLIGISERVSPDEIDSDSLFSIYHRTLEWNQKKEIGVVVFNSYPDSVKSFIRLRTATEMICAYNSQKMKVRQQLTRIEEDLWELTLLVKLNANGYTSYILRYCEGPEREEGLSKPIQGKFFDGDAYRIEFDETGRFTNVTSKLDKVVYSWENEVCVMKTMDGVVQPSDTKPEQEQYFNPLLTRYVPRSQTLTYSALRGPLVNVMVQRYSPSVTVVTRIIKSVNVNKKIASRGHLIDQSIILKDRVSEGDLVLVHRLQDIHNLNRIHVDLNGYGTQLREAEPIPENPTEAAAWAHRSHFAATNEVFIEDEDLDRSKQDVARASFYFDRPRGVMVTEGTVMIPLTMGGVTRDTPENEEEKRIDLNIVEQQVALMIERSNKGLFANSEKLFSSMIFHPHFFMYYNNTKENKNNMNLKHVVTQFKTTLPNQISILSFQRLTSLKHSYLMRLQNTAEATATVKNEENLVTVNLASLAKSIGLKNMKEVSLFGTSENRVIEEQRLLWTGEDGIKSGGVLRDASDFSKVEFLPQQIRSFLFTN